MVPRGRPTHGFADCPICFEGYDQISGLAPVSLLLGEKREEVTDLSINTPAGLLAFTRSYRQSLQNVFKHLGAGWTHNHYVYIEEPVGQSDQLIMHMPNGGDAHFTQSEEDADRYDGDPGSASFIMIDTGSTDARYTLTAADKSTYAFNASKWLQFRTWPNGERWDYNYDSNNQLLDVTDNGYDVDSAKRHLAFTYIDDPQDTLRKLLKRVTDHTGRFVEFDYVAAKVDDNGEIVDGAFSLLSQVTDVRGEDWTYDYYGQNLGETLTEQLNYLTKYISPLVDTTGAGIEDTEIVLKQLEYTVANDVITSITQQQGVVGQFPALLETEFNFHLSGTSSTTQITDETTAQITKHHLFAGEVFAGTKDQQGNYSARSLDLNYRPERHFDANNNQILLAWSEEGARLSSLMDALGNTTAFFYEDDLLTSSEDAEGRTTEYTYGDTNNPRLPTRVQVADVDDTVLRVQKFSYDNKGRTLTERLVDPADEDITLRETVRTYYQSGLGNGLLHKVTQTDMNGSNDVETTYTYDAFGRIVQTQQSSAFGSCNISYTVYDEAGNVVASICNYENNADPPIPPGDADDAAALYDIAYPDKNRVTIHQYDALGRRVQTTTNAGIGANAIYARTNLTFYDALNRVVRTITNYEQQGTSAPGDWVWRAVSENEVLVWRWRLSSTDDTPVSHGTDNMLNSISDTAYNERGLLKSQRDTLGNVMLYGYDDADRLVKTVQSAGDPAYDNSYGQSGDPDLSYYTANDRPDQDIITTQLYDPAGNLVKATDALGNASFTVYNALNRPVKTVRSASNPTYDILGDLPLSGYTVVADPDQDLVETTEYDAQGRVIRTTDSLSSVTLYGYDPLGRQVKMIRSASNPTYDLATDPDLSGYSPSTDPDRDVITLTTHDTAGRVLYTEDILGRRTWSAYDGLGRQVKSIGNAVGTATDGGANDPRSSSYVPSTDLDQDLITLTHYDNDGRVQWTQGKLGRKTWYVYDELGRQVKDDRQLHLRQRHPRAGRLRLCRQRRSRRPDH